MSYESAASVQAELRTVRRSTIERKHMSTKTTMKRISLVAVAALGFGVLSVAPSFAAASASVVTTSTTVAYGSSKTVPTVGATVSLDVLLAITANASAAADETSTVVATVTTKPNNSLVAAESVTASVTGAAAAYSAATASANALRFFQATAATTTGKIGTATFTPDVPGKYVITLTPTNGGVAGLTASAGTARTVEVNVGGVALTQGATNLGKATTGTQILGRPSTFTFNVPAGAAQNARYTITSTGTISTVYSGTANLGASASAYTVTTGVTAVTGSTYASGAVYTVQTSGGTTTTGTLATNNYPAAMEQISIQVESPAVAGAVSVSVKSADALTGEVTTVGTGTVTYAAAAAAPSILADATSTSILAKGAVANSAEIVDSATVTAAKTAGTQAATIYVTQKSAITTAVPNESMTVTISGPGILGAGASHTEAASGRSLLVKNGHYITVWPDNTSGEATITIVASTSGVTLGVEKITFFDTTPSSASVVVNKAHILAGTGSVADVFTVKVLDKSGNAVTAVSALTAAAVDTTTVVGGAVTCSTTYNTTKAGFLCSVVGKSATKFGKVSYKFTAAGTDTAETEVTATADVTFSFGVAKTVVVTGPTTAGYGEEITLTFTAKDENDLPVADQTYEGAAATGGLFWNTTTVPVYVGSGFAPFNSGETITTVSGVATKKLTLPTAGPLASASWTLAGDGIVAAGAVDKSIGKTKVTYSVTLNNPAVDAATDAANEAVDAANAATDAALAAAEAADAATSAAQEASDAVAALSESVTKLIAGLQSQIKSLAAVVAKIAKKVKA
jgi:trimeric autotransporter adhesin